MSDNAEALKRRCETDSVRRMVESEGLKLPAFALAQVERYVSGEINRKEFLESL